MFQPVDVSRLRPDGPIHSPYDRGRAAYLRAQLDNVFVQCPYFGGTQEASAWMEGMIHEAEDAMLHETLIERPN